MENQQQNNIIVPKFYKPRPYQVESWKRRLSGKYKYYFKIWARQAGKDTDDIQYELKRAWDNPGTQAVYVGLDNGWVKQNIFNKYIDKRTHWMDYPEDLIEIKDTARSVIMNNNPKGTAPATTKFIGFLNDQAIIGSSYDRFTVSELSLYKRGAFDFVEPIWNNKIAQGEPIEVSFNSTPRGMNNLLFDMLKKYTKKDHPEDFPGEHGDTYVDVLTIEDLVRHDGTKIYDEAYIEELKARYIRQFGNLNMFNQEYMVDFLTVNAGLVYQGIEQLIKEGRYKKININPAHPAYIALDIAAKGKMTDWTAAIAFQYYNGTLFIIDHYKNRGLALVEAIAEIAQRPWWKYIRIGFLPWDSDRSASSMSPKDEAEAQYPSVKWHMLGKERVDRGIKEARRLLPNTVINICEDEYGIDELMESFSNYEYKRLDKKEDWAATPMHNKYSHLMDAFRYAAMGLKEMDYLKLGPDGSDPEYPEFYEAGTEPTKPLDIDRRLGWQKPSSLSNNYNKDEPEFY